VVFTLDGEEIEAERGEPLAMSLLAAGKRTIARSPKFHRPRGPTCLRGACDGCLARVNETPNIMTCMTPAADGMEVISQNRLGPRDADLLRMTDWFFPEGMNHHELFAGIPGIQTIMQGFARRVAGLGRLPGAAEPPRPAARRSADVVVVGAGPAGMAVAARLAAPDRVVEVLDDQLAPGGGVTALAPEDRAPFEGILRAFDASVASGRVRLRTRTTAGAIYGRDLLVAGPDGVEIVAAKALVLACGAHDGALAFEGNDVPGVMSARAGGWLLSHGILVAERIAVVVSDGGGPFGASFARAAAAQAPEGVEVELVHGEPIATRGSSSLKGIRVRGKDGKERNVDADLVLVDAPRSPAYELAEQAGGKVVLAPKRGFVVHTERGLVAPADASGGAVWAVGEVTGVPFEAGALETDAASVAAEIHR
jgi:sarcosine oxidase subunit alpha